jgi:hypothetical protein
MMKAICLVLAALALSGCTHTFVAPNVRNASDSEVALIDHPYGVGVVKVDGTPITEQLFIGTVDDKYVLKLPPGYHVLTLNYCFCSLRGTRTYMRGTTDFPVDLQAGKRYRLAADITGNAWKGTGRVHYRIELEP